MKLFVDPPPINIYRDIVDFRKSINGLVLVLEQELGRYPFSLIETAKANEIIAFDCLEHLLVGLPKRKDSEGVDDLMPWGFK